MFARLPARRAIAASAVLLFHLLVLFALIQATKVQLVSRTSETIITLFFRPGMEKKQTLPEHLPPLPEHTWPVPVLPITPPPPPIVQAPPSDKEGLRGVGRYLYNCSGMFYEQLSDREWQHCLANLWDQPKGTKEKAPVLAAPKPSPFDVVIQERKKKAVPIEHQCKLGQMNSNLGLPCYDFSGN